jgi:dihydrofolate reductase
MATSLNGMIADKNGKEDFLSEKNWDTFLSLAKKSGNFVIGRKTLDAIESWGEEYSLNKIPGIKKVVLSKSKKTKSKDYDIASSPQKAIDLLKSEGFKTILLSGGSKANSAFAEQGLIDEIILNVNSSVVGEGIPLFSKSDFQFNCKLTKSKELDDGIVQLRYSVIKD